jgi:hypothetical protein
MAATGLHGTPTISWIDPWNWAHHGRIGLGLPGGPNNMSFLVRVTSSDFSGFAKITQLCALDFSGLGGGAGLDNADPYHPSADILVARNPNPQGSINLMNLDDAPQAPGYDSVRLNGTFTDYIMFSPGGVGDIYVTLGKVVWTTTAGASYPNLTISPNNVLGPAGPDGSDDFPIWLNTVSTP